MLLIDHIAGLLSVLSLISFISGAVLPTPDLTQEQQLSWKPIFDAGPQTSRTRQTSDQVTLLQPEHRSKKSAALEIERFDILGSPYYFTNIAFGNPAQPFRVLIDLSYGGLAVRSVDCPNHDCGYGIFSYNSTASTTSNATGIPFGILLPAQTASGWLFNDEMHIVSLPLPNATFGAIDEFYGENFLVIILSNLCDGAMGLAPPNATSSSYEGGRRGAKLLPNFLYELTTSGALEHNVMTLKLPEDADSKGKLIVGEAAPPHYDYRITLSQRSAPGLLEESWRVDLPQITIAGTPLPLMMKLNTTAAVTLDPGHVIALPTDIASAIWDYLGAEWSDDFLAPMIDCDTRDTLPDLTITLGSQNLTVGWKDYAGEAWLGSEHFCALHIQFIYPGVTDGAILGLRLLRNFDTTFDMERGEIGLTKL